MKNQNVYRARENRKQWSRDADVVRRGYSQRKTQRKRIMDSGLPTFTTSDGRVYKGRQHGFSCSTVIRIL